MSLGLPGSGAIPRLEAAIFRLGEARLRAVGSVSAKQQFEFLVPPGDYAILLSAGGCYITYRYVHVGVAVPTPEMVIDLPPIATKALIGRIPPELQGIREWKNSAPVKLAESSGKVMLLDFWGVVPGPCVGSMPYLMKLHDEAISRDKGLVIVAVRDDSVPSIAEMDRQLDERRKTFWDGRDLPFLVALDGGGETRIRYTAITTRGATTAAYGITGFPTTLLVGRDGKVIESINDSAAAALQPMSPPGSGPIACKDYCGHSSRKRSFDCNFAPPDSKQRSAIACRLHLTSCSLSSLPP